MTAAKKATKATKAAKGKTFAPGTMTPAERQANRRARLAQEGGRVLSLTLTAAGAKALDKLTTSGLSATDAINAALIAATTRKR